MPVPSPLLTIKPGSPFQVPEPSAFTLTNPIGPFQVPLPSPLLVIRPLSPFHVPAPFPSSRINPAGPLYVPDPSACTEMIALSPPSPAAGPLMVPLPSALTRTSPPSTLAVPLPSALILKSPSSLFLVRVPCASSWVNPPPLIRPPPASQRAGATVMPATGSRIVWIDASSACCAGVTPKMPGTTMRGMTGNGGTSPGISASGRAAGAWAILLPLAAPSEDLPTAPGSRSGVQALNAISTVGRRSALDDRPDGCMDAGTSP
ncbi:hypothetical protein D3C71_1396650 [compost metagenome]